MANFRYLKKSASQEERQKEKVMAEEKEYFKALRQSQNTWGRKLDKIKEREMAMRRNAEQKLVRFELEAQDKVGTLQVIGWLIDWLIDWYWCDWLIDWLIEWVSDSLIGWLFDWLIDLKLNTLVGRFIDILN